MKITSIDGKIFSRSVSHYDPKTVYQVGKTVKPNTFNPDPTIECSNGIHFFLTKEEAQAYEF